MTSFSHVVTTQLCNGALFRSRRFLGMLLCIPINQSFPEFGQPVFSITLHVFGINISWLLDPISTIEQKRQQLPSMLFVSACSCVDDNSLCHTGELNRCRFGDNCGKRYAVDSRDLGLLLLNAQGFGSRLCVVSTGHLCQLDKLLTSSKIGIRRKRMSLVAPASGSCAEEKAPLSRLLLPLLP